MIILIAFSTMGGMMYGLYGMPGGVAFLLTPPSEPLCSSIIMIVSR